MNILDYIPIYYQPPCHLDLHHHLRHSLDSYCCSDFSVNWAKKIDMGSRKKRK